jgi:hypothetical protein
MSALKKVLASGAVLLLDIAGAIASPGTLTNDNSTKPCVQLEVPVHVVANNTASQGLRVDSNSDAVEFMLDME